MVHSSSAIDVSLILTEIRNLKEDIASLRSENIELRRKLEEFEHKLTVDACAATSTAATGDDQVVTSLSSVVVSTSQDQKNVNFVTSRKEPYSDALRSFPPWSFKTP